MILKIPFPSESPAGLTAPFFASLGCWLLSHLAPRDPSRRQRAAALTALTPMLAASFAVQLGTKQSAASERHTKRTKHVALPDAVPLKCARRSFQPTRQPHIMVLMADDLGYLDTSYAGSTVVRTPHLDVLSLHGTILSQFRAPTWYAAQIRRATPSPHALQKVALADSTCLLGVRARVPCLASPPGAPLRVRRS